MFLLRKLSAFFSTDFYHNFLIKIRLKGDVRRRRKRKRERGERREGERERVSEKEREGGHSILTSLQGSLFNWQFLTTEKGFKEIIRMAEKIESAHSQFLLGCYLL